jgi:phage terminase Nu1 subunit (DNA packaging protein)
MNIDSAATQREFAELIGTSQQAVSGLVRRGVLKRGGSYRAWLIAYCESLRDAAAGRADERDPSLVAARRRLLELQAGVVELDLAQRRRELVTVAEAVATWSRLVVALRQRLLLLPKAAAPLCASRPAAEAQAVLERLVHEALSELAGDGSPLTGVADGAD